MSKPSDASGEHPRVAIVGAGYIADFHVTAVRALGGAELVGICDLSRARAEKFAAAHGIEGAFDDLPQMLEQSRPSVVHVLTPPNAHLAPCTTTLRAGADVLVEKPMCHTVAECQMLAQVAASTGRSVGVGHNFLFFPAYERLVDDLQAGRFGELDQVDIVWNKELGQLRGGPFGAWMLADPRNILFEVAPHAFAHAVHLVGRPDDVQVRAYDPFTLPTGGTFFRRWEILAWRGVTTVRIRLSFVPGYPEHYVHVRGFNGTGHVDFEQNTYVHHEHTPHLLDVDRFANVAAGARDSVVQATGTLAGFVLAKAGLAKVGGPFAVSIARAVAAFYATRKNGVDERLGAALASDAVAFGERVAAQVSVPTSESARKPNGKPVQPAPAPKVLVIGGTGFIGQAIVGALRRAGHGVRVMARNPGNLPAELVALGVDATGGDF